MLLICPLPSAWADCCHRTPCPRAVACLCSCRRLAVRAGSRVSSEPHTSTCWLVSLRLSATSGSSSCLGSVSLGQMAGARAVGRALAGRVGGAGRCWCCQCCRWHYLMTSVILHPQHSVAVPVWTLLCPAARALAQPGLAVSAAGEVLHQHPVGTRSLWL